MRQWYTELSDQFDCKQFSEKWTTKKWKSFAGCTVLSNNFTVLLHPHCQPFYVGGGWRNRSLSLNCIPKRIDDISNDVKAIIVIHLFVHMRTMHANNYKIKMQIIRASVERLLGRHRNVKVLIKMPHTFRNTHYALNDFFGYIYSKIIVEVFRGLYDKVIVLNQRDATNAILSNGLHPDSRIVKSMIYQLFSYLCE